MDCVVEIQWDDEAGLWTTANDYFPFALEAESLDRLMERVRMIIPEMVELNHLVMPKYLTFHVMCREEVSV